MTATGKGVSVHYSSSELAKKIASHYGGTAKPINVKMVGAVEVSGLISKIRRARRKAYSKPLKLD